jgi:hypothetical protein
MLPAGAQARAVVEAPSHLRDHPRASHADLGGPVDADGQSLSGQACRSAGRPRRDLTSGRRSPRTAGPCRRCVSRSRSAFTAAGAVRPAVPRVASAVTEGRCRPQGYWLPTRACIVEMQASSGGPGTTVWHSAGDAVIYRLVPAFHQPVGEEAQHSTAPGTRASVVTCRGEQSGDADRQVSGDLGQGAVLAWLRDDWRGNARPTRCAAVRSPGRGWRRTRWP